MKDYASIICKKCGREFASPYPSLQKNPPIAPSREELMGVCRLVDEMFKMHQNNNCKSGL